MFVTHSTDSVIKYCDRAIMLEEGELKMTGTPKDVVQAYLELMFDSDVDVSKPVVIDAANYSVDFDPSVDHCPTQPTYNA